MTSYAYGNKNIRSSKWEAYTEHKVKVVEDEGASEAHLLMIAQGENKSSQWDLRIDYFLIGWNGCRDR
jgi:hypothetical protein